MGWALVNIKGSHHVFVKSGRRPLAVVNHPGELDSYLVERVLDEMERDLEEQEEAQK